MDLDELMEGAKLKVDKAIADEEWESRNIGWFRIDLDKHPELALEE